MTRQVLILVVAFVAAASADAGRAQSQQRAENVTAAEVQAAIDKLGSFDFPVRSEAARVVRRAAAEVAVPPLARAARSHSDEYVRFRALTILSGFGGPAAASAMQDLKGDRNDRLRAVAYAWFEHAPDPAVLPSLIEALDKERSEFVRPALTRAIAAHGDDPRARAALTPLVLRGEDFFRGATIEALGDYKGTYALAEILSVAKLDGPLQDDAISAIGKIGDKTMIPQIAALQKAAPREVQPTVVAALCLLESGCPAAEDYLTKTLTFAATTDGYAPLLRGVVHALGLLAARGRASALRMLLDRGVGAGETARGTIALGVGLVAIRQPEMVMAALESRSDRAAAIDLLRDAFDMLSEDFEEERFFVAVRRSYWAAAAGSARRQVADTLIQRLEF